MDDWTPEREQPVTAEWLAAEQERLEQQAEGWRANDIVPDEQPGANGSGRMSDGRFKKLPDPERVFRTDGAEPVGPTEFQEALLKIRAVTRWPRVVSPYVAMEIAVAMRRLCDELEYEAVAFARSHEWSWKAVGDALGMTESGAHRRFAGYRGDPERRRRR